MPQPEFIRTNGIRMAVFAAGTGPPVVFCHGFPELAYSWRHQLPAVAAAGFHAIAPDQRGYGLTDRPKAIEDYDIHHLTADLPQHIAVPCLMIMAENDYVLPPSAADAMDKHCSNLEKHLIRNCGHWTQQEHPEEVNRVLVDWLQRNFG
jgi:pimeloyl-ACP methyl ester carboxylesterase